MNKYHVYPKNDLRNHIIDSPHCWCNPIEDDWTIIHNSMDRREEYEQGSKVH